jgi:hypothetical protein
MPSTLSTTTYDVGDRVKLSAEIRDLESVGSPLIDPDTLVFKMLEPNATITTYTYGVDPELVRDSVGVFHVEWDVDQAGNHWSRFAASGNVGAAEERGFKVRAPRVTP